MLSLAEKLLAVSIALSSERLFGKPPCWLDVCVVAQGHNELQVTAGGNFKLRRRRMLRSGGRIRRRGLEAAHRKNR